MKTLPRPTEQRFLLQGMDWKSYRTILQGLADRPVFVTYDRGNIEIMSPSSKHEGYGRLLDRLIGVVTEELGLPILSGGCTTFRREDLDRGLEPDECYWIQNEARVRGVEEVDLTRDPPPDLAIEVEISRRLLDREAIYAALEVPELWRFDGERLRMFRLGRDGRYRACRSSPSLPSVPAAVYERHLAMKKTADETSIVRSFREWIRTHTSR